MQVVFTLGWASYVLGKFIIDNALFLSKWKDAVYNEGDLLPIYIHKKGTWEDSCYFDKELPNKDNDSDKEMKDNKVDKENKENIFDSKPLKVLASNETTQTSPR